MNMKWTVRTTSKASKQVAKLPPFVRRQFALLVKELEDDGPLRANWSHFGKLKGFGGDVYHCHIKSGRPTFVVCWEVVSKEIRLLEVFYAGSHEKAPY